MSAPDFKTLANGTGRDAVALGVLKLAKAAGLPSLGSQSQDWPTSMSEAAYHGVVGDIVRKIEPHTESDIHAVLVQFLAFFGNAAGRDPHVRIERDRHGANINVVIVGNSATARKGTSSGQALAPVAAADPHWAAERQAAGLSSGEGLIHAVRDPVTKIDREGETVIVDPGVIDKRLMVRESEFASVLKRAGREGNTISTEIRQAWDSHDLRVMTRNSPLTAKDPHISIVAHITTDELGSDLKSVDQANGFANRFLFPLARRSRDLPFGGEIENEDFSAEIEAIGKALTFARFRCKTPFRFGDDARERWAAMYAELVQDRPGQLGHLLARAPSHVLRLALIYALLDRSKTLEVAHLEAGREVWRYAEDSARIIFKTATGNPLADDLLSHLREAGGAGLTRTEIRDKLGRHARKDAVATALDVLAGRGLATKATEATEGRSVERWTVASADVPRDRSDLATDGGSTR